MERLRGRWFAGPVRIAEWVSAVWALWWCRCLVGAPHLFGTAQAYSTLRTWADERAWAVVFFALALLHLAFTVAPGRNVLPRRVACAAAILIWGTVTTGLLLGNVNSPGAIYSATLTVGLGYCLVVLQ